MRPRPRPLRLPLALLVGLLPGCAQSLGTGTRAARPGASAPAAPAARPEDPSLAAPPDPADPRVRRLGTLDALLARWDRAQGEGRPEAAALAAQLRAEVEAGYADVAAAHAGEAGPEGRLVATMALGFAPRAEATGLLVRTLNERDPRLVANALIALKLRADPATPLEPLVFYLRSSNEDVRRYAPLALAHVLEARRRAGAPADRATEATIFDRTLPAGRDADVLVRLHSIRLFGQLSLPEVGPVLRAFLDDPSSRLQVAAASALAARADPEAFPGVLRLLQQAPPQGRPLVADLLSTYAERLSGAPLPAAERQRLGVDPVAWARWYAGWQRSTRPPG